MNCCRTFVAHLPLLGDGFEQANRLLCFAILLGWAPSVQRLIPMIDYHNPKRDGQTGRVEGGQPCPQTGYWFTPAQSESRRHFQQGDLMPAFEGSQHGRSIFLAVPKA